MSHTIRNTLLLSSVLCCLSTAPALAQRLDNRALVERMESIERNVMLLQRQVATGEPGEFEGGIPSDASVARLEARLAAIEEQIRSLQGRIEEEGFKNQRLADQLDKLSRDVDARFMMAQKVPTETSDVEQSSAPTPSPATATPEGTPPPTVRTVTAPAPAASSNIPEFETPREHYNYAFKLLNQAKYAEAAGAFDAFIKKHPEDALTGNAYYWLGETFYVRKDYVKAADYFRQGFEVLPKGPKAADNLLKLAMSLDALKQTKESCVVLEQLVAKFGNASETVREKAETEQKRIGCE